jgi:apolipoprotein D and lipocalin family protein
MRNLSIILFLLFILSCSGNKVEVRRLNNFESEKYLGKWYEIARIDNKFEKNLINATAEYSLNSDGSIKVINKGYDKTKNTEKIIEGKAKIIDKGLLKVYFVPFFGADYNVLYVDSDYQYAVVGGNKSDYLWVLSRKDTLEEDIFDKLVKIAFERGYDVELLQKFSDK